MELMDLVCKVPREISLHILSFLPPSELVKCFFVSKSWFNLANTDYLWKRHCLVRQLDRAKISRNRTTSLCNWADVYRSYIRKVNGWDYDRAQNFRINLNSCNFVLAFGELSIAVHYFSPVDDTIEQLYFYHMFEEDVKCEEVLDLELPGRGIVQLFMNDVYTLVSRDNFILCVKKVDGKHVNHVGLCLRGGLLEYANENIASFINSKRCVSRDLTIRGLSGCYVWLDDENRSIHVFNLENNSSVIVECLHEVKITNGLVAVWSNTAVKIYSSNGSIIQSILVDFVQDLCFNKNTLASLLPDTGHHSRLLLTFDISTGQKLMEKTVMRFTDITLHYDNDTIYALERSSRDLYRVSSLCAKTGRTLWSISQPNMFYNMWPATIQLVSYKHLYVWPSNNRTDKYSVFNCKTGKHLYVSCKVLGSIQWISNSVCISLDGNVLHIKSFL